MKNKGEVKMFLDREIRVIDKENVPLLDVFNALGRLTKDGKIDTKDRRKIYKVFELNGYNNAFDKKIYYLKSILATIDLGNII